jgi:hypothetical protein
MLVYVFQPVAATTIKKTPSGICHPPASSYYDRTKNFKAFGSLEACLETGGRLPRRLADAYGSRSLEANPDQYQRSAFGHGWDDSDGDCQNSRMEALISQSTRPVQFADDSDCRVIRGRWISPFTGNVITDASKLDIDHVVPLKFAWDHGAGRWTRDKREQFANDPVNLSSVELSLNRSKGAKGLSGWLPPSGQCQYIARFIRVVKIYDLALESDEISDYEKMRQRCYTQFQ